MVIYNSCDIVSKFRLGDVVEDDNNIKWGRLLHPCAKRTSFVPKRLAWAPMTARRFGRQTWQGCVGQVTELQ